MTGLLSTAAPLLVLNLLAAPAPNLDELKARYQRKADEAVWRWDEDKAHVDASVARYRGGYDLEFKWDSPDRASGATIHFRKEGKEVFTLKGHRRTQFAQQGSVLYYVDFEPSKTGCAVIAYDLEKGKQLWRTNLKGLGPIGHKDYRNAVLLEVNREVVTVWGDECLGRYLEFVDVKTGTTVGHRLFKDEDD
jgi:hypothetical protein